MANVNPQYVTGPRLGITITPQDVATGGAWTDNADGAFSFNGRLDPSYMSGGYAYTFENLASSNSPLSNPVPNELTATYELTELEMAVPIVSSSAKTVVNGNVLEYCYKKGQFFKLIITRYDNSGTAVTGGTETAYVVLQGVQRSRTKGKATMSGTFQTVQLVVDSTGAYVANPAFS